MNKEEIQKLKDILWANTWDDKQIIEEGIATLKNAFDLQDEGFRRIESAGLLAIYTLQHQLEEKNKVIDEILNHPFFTNECPYSSVGDGFVQELCDCDNCQDNYKKCWLTYFENKILERSKDEQ